MGDTDRCTHSNTVDDERVADVVCIDCGLVMERLLTLNAVSGKESLHVNRSCEEKWEQYFHDICDANMINDGTAKVAACEFRKMKRIGKKKLRGFHDKSIAAYSMYVAALKEGAGRAPEEVSCLTGISTSTLCKMEGIFPTQPQLSNACNFLPRLSFFLDLEWRDQQVILEWNNRLTVADGYRPKTVIATLILIYCIQQKRLDPTIKRISEVCGASTSAMKKLMPTLKEELEIK